MKPDDPRIVPLGDSALGVEFADRIDPAINARCIAAADALMAASIPGVRDIVPTFRSVAVYFDPLTTDQPALRQILVRAAASSSTATIASARTIRVPVCYGGDDGPDLPAVAAFAKSTPDDVIKRHASATYRVFMLGFVPGFTYMGMVDDRIAAPRHETPRTKVPAGSVGIAGRQTGIYPSEVPGGWQLIGRTPLQIFDSRRPQPSLFRAGDVVQFFPISRGEWDRFV